MLPAKLGENEDKSRARLSHAIRALAKAQPTNEFVQIDSLNLFELVNKPLPSIDRQIINLLEWAAKQLGDDQLGTLEMPDSEQLAGIIGTLDGARVEELLRLADNDGLIDIPYDSCMTITRDGWQRLESESVPQSTQPNITPERHPVKNARIVMAHCNKCNGERSSHVRAGHSVTGSDDEVSWVTTFEVLECCGCADIIVREQFSFSEWDSIEEDDNGIPYLRQPIKTTYWPPPSKRKKPEWSSELSDPAMSTLFDEIYTALASGLVVLATIGARTLFDRASFLQVGDPEGGFYGKLKAMVDAKHISDSEKGILEAMTDAGSAAAHRGYSPNNKQLSSIMDILENYLHRSFILGDAATALKQTTPPRPKPEKQNS